MADFSGEIITQPSNVIGEIDTYTVTILDTYPAPTPIYRGLLSGVYVYSAGSAPLGATDVIIAGYK